MFNIFFKQIHIKKKNSDSNFPSLVPQVSAGWNVVDSVNMVNPVLKEIKTEDISHHQWNIEAFLNIFTAHTCEDQT